MSDLLDHPRRATPAPKSSSRLLHGERCLSSLANAFTLRFAAALLLLPATLFLAGCPGIQERAEGRQVAAEYSGLEDKSVAIVVYIPPATIDEYSGAREEISSFIASQMRQHLPKTRLLNPRDVTTWQNNTINWYALPEKDIGRHFSVDRVLYVEVADYSTKRTIGYSDLQGHIRAKVKVFETDTPGTSPAWSAVEDASWPTDRPLDPTQTNDSAVRVRTLELFSDQLVQYFYKHQDFTLSPRDR